MPSGQPVGGNRVGFDVKLEVDAAVGQAFKVGELPGSPRLYLDRGLVNQDRFAKRDLWQNLLPILSCGRIQCPLRPASQQAQFLSAFAHGFGKARKETQPAVGPGLVTVVEGCGPHIWYNRRAVRNDRYTRSDRPAGRRQCPKLSLAGSGARARLSLQLHPTHLARRRR